MVLRPPPRSMIEISFGLRCFHPLLSSRVRHTQSSRSGATHPLSNQWLSSASGLRPSAISNLSFSMLCFSQSILSRVCDLMTCVLSQIDDSQLLRLFGVRRFPTLLLCFLPEYFHPEFTIFRHVPSGSDGPDSLRFFGSSGFGSFRLLCTHFSWSAFTQTSWISTMCPSAMDGCDLLQPLGLREFVIVLEQQGGPLGKWVLCLNI
jgi:hypothetical protein